MLCHARSEQVRQQSRHDCWSNKIVEPFQSLLKQTGIFCEYVVSRMCRVRQTERVNELVRHDIEAHPAAGLAGFRIERADPRCCRDLDGDLLDMCRAAGVEQALPVKVASGRRVQRGLGFGFLVGQLDDDLDAFVRQLTIDRHDGLVDDPGPLTAAQAMSDEDPDDAALPNGVVPGNDLLLGLAGRGHRRPYNEPRTP